MNMNPTLLSQIQADIALRGQDSTVEGKGINPAVEWYV